MSGVLCELKDCLYNLVELHYRLRYSSKVVDVVDLMDNCDEKVIAEKYNQKIMENNEIKSNIVVELENFEGLINSYFGMGENRFNRLRIDYDDKYHVLRVKKPLFCFKEIDEFKVNLVKRMVSKIKRDVGFPMTCLVYKPNVLDINL